MVLNNTQSAAAPAADQALLAQLQTMGRLSHQQADYARRVARSLAEPASQVLRLLRMASDSDIARARPPLHSLSPGWPEAARVDTAALARVPFAFARQHRMLPVRAEGDVLQIAIDNPDDADARQRLRRHVPGEVHWIVSPRAPLSAAIEMAYHFATHPSAAELERELARVGGDLDGGRLVRLALADGVERGASDVHFTPSGFALMISFRIDGVLQLQHVLPAALHVRVASAIKVEAGMDIAESRKPQDGSFALPLAGQQFDLRVSSMPTTHGENLVVRILSLRGDVLPLDQSGFWPEQVAQIERLMRAPDGLVLTTGPTGSGKTTTLHAGLRLINALERNIMTVEDPVEYHVPLVRQVRLNERAGMTFASALKGFLRQDPDVMLVGEIRDAETALPPGPSGAAKRPRRYDLRQRREGLPAPGPGRDAGRRDPRCGDRLDGGARRADRSPGAGHAAHQRCGGRHRPPARSVGAGLPDVVHAAGCDRATPGAASVHPLPGAHCRAALQGGGLRSLQRHRLPLAAGRGRGAGDRRRPAHDDRRAGG